MIWVFFLFSFIFFFFVFVFLTHCSCFVVDLLRLVVMLSMINLFMGFRGNSSDDKICSDILIISNRIH